MTGRYPNLGPQVLVEAGIPLIDDVGTDVFDKVATGARSAWTATRSTSAT